MMRGLLKVPEALEEGFLLHTAEIMYVAIAAMIPLPEQRRENSESTMCLLSSPPLVGGVSSPRSPSSLAPRTLVNN